jgi:hypothetical protein
MPVPGAAGQQLREHVVVGIALRLERHAGRADAGAAAVEQRRGDAARADVDLLVDERVAHATGGGDRVAERAEIGGSSENCSMTRRPLRKPIMLGAIGSGLLAFGYPYAIRSRSRSVPLAIAMSLLTWGVVYQGDNAVFPSFYPERFPTRARVSAIAHSQNVGTMLTAMLPAVSAAMAPPGMANIPLTVGGLTLPTTLIAAVSAWSARETYRMPFAAFRERDAHAHAHAQRRIRTATRGGDLPVALAQGRVNQPAAARAPHLACSSLTLELSMISGNTTLIAHIGLPTETFKASRIRIPWFDKHGIDAVIPMRAPGRLPGEP